MKLQFKHQKFQADAAKAVVDVFAGQPYLTPSYMMDRGDGVINKGYTYDSRVDDDDNFTGWSNAKLISELNDRLILERIQKIQRANLIEPSPKLEGRFNLTIEMETGVGKTYTYIKTMYELNKHYGWSKFIVVVPSVAIREGVYKSLGQFTRNYTQTVKRAADNKRRYAPGEGSIPPVLLSGVSKGVPPLAHDFACKV